MTYLICLLVKHSWTSLGIWRYCPRCKGRDYLR